MEKAADAVIDASDRLVIVRDYDQAIASEHHERLRYPPNLLAHALVLGLRGMSSTDAARRALRDGNLLGTEEGVGQYLARLKNLPPLLPGVAEGLRLAATNGLKIYVVTEGPQEKATKTLIEHGLLEQVDQVLSATKTVTLYRRLKTLADAACAAMIGDQLDRDVLLARDAGLVAIWVPSAFRPKWIDPDSAVNASFVASDFLSAVRWLLEKGAEDSLPESVNSEPRL